MAHTVVIKQEYEPEPTGEVPAGAMAVIVGILGWLQFYIPVPNFGVVHWIMAIVCGLMAGVLFLAALEPEG